MIDPADRVVRVIARRTSYTLIRPQIDDTVNTAARVGMWAPRVVLPVAD